MDILANEGGVPDDKLLDRFIVIEVPKVTEGRHEPLEFEWELSMLHSTTSKALARVCTC